ncbi:MAG: M20 family metallopeptidase [Calditerrivibrio sp.]|nr:M20 family metallopeptidase [Calditerrivibrio sp.]MCA1933525.1 M20 family metallopeptidase [Calditerrivibrio sp.]MCA1980985.1 M20 family metallopeptidase [Calditerrivibrio sp.]
MSLVDLELNNIFSSITDLAEPSFKEYETTNYIDNYLKKIGFSDYKRYDTGIYGTINLGKKETVAIRADIDALPYDLTRNIYKHLCGHNLHLSALLSTLVLISRNVIKPKVNLRYIFQPAEEIISGANFMIKNGCMKGVKKIYALHVDPEVEFGTIGLKDGPIMAGSKHFKITFNGKGTHAAYPHKGSDLIVASSIFITNVQTIVSRKINPIKSAVISFGKIEGGTAANILPPNLTILGTFRFLDNETRDVIEKSLKLYLKSISKQFDIIANIEISEGTYPVINDANLVKKLKEICKRENINYSTEIPTSMGGEDFCFYSKYAPSLFMRLGIKTKDTFPLHNPNFFIPEGTLENGVRLWKGVLENE